MLLRLRLLHVAVLRPKGVTVTDLNVLHLVAQVCLRRRSEEAAAEDAGGPAHDADRGAAGPPWGSWHPLHPRTC